MGFKAASASEYYDEIVNNYKEALTVRRNLKPIILRGQFGETMAERNRRNMIEIANEQAQLLVDPLHEHRRFAGFHIDLLRFSQTAEKIRGARNSRTPTLNLFFENITKKSTPVDRCPVCDVTMHVSTDNGIFICPTCSRYTEDHDILENSNLVTPRESKSSRTMQQCSKHIRLEQILSSLDGSCFINASQETKDEIRKIIDSEASRIIESDISATNPDSIRDIFKRHKKGNLYKHVPAVYCNIIGKPYLHFSQEQRKLIFIIFDEIIKLWAEEFPEEENFSHYNTVFKMVLEMIGKQDYVSLLHETKNQSLRKSKMEKMNRVFSNLNTDQKFRDLISRIRSSS